MAKENPSQVTAESQPSGSGHTTTSSLHRHRKFTNRGRGIPGFWWTGRIFWKGYHHTLDEADVYDVLPRDSTVKLSNNLAREWEKELYSYKTGGRPRLTRALWRCYRSQIAAFTILIFMEEALRVAQAVLMGLFINLFVWDDTRDGAVRMAGSTSNVTSSPVASSNNNKDDENERDLKVPDLYIIIALIVVVYLISIFLDHNFFHHGYRMRVATTSLIYRKVLRLRSASLTPAVMETAMNLVSKEMDVFHMVVLPATYILIGPIQLAVTCYLLWFWLDLGPVCLASLLFLILLFPLQIIMGKLSRILRDKCDNRTNNRLRRLQLIMSGLEDMKTSNWTNFCLRVMARARRSELKQMKKLSRLQFFNSALTLTSGKVVVMVTFLFMVVMGHEISAKQVFTTLALIEALRLSLSILLPSGILTLIDTKYTINRVEELLLLPEKSSLLSRPSSMSLCEEIVIRFSSYFASREKNIDAPMVLVNIDLDIEKNKLYCVIGPPESGKSCLLLAIQGELERHKGHLFHDGRLGYIPARPWLCPGTIRENILFGTEYSYSRYSQVLFACSLNEVIDALPLRDTTIVGERGLALDQSIQAKITLARAVYQNCDIYLIDDILSGMDAKSAMHIFKKCICGLLRTKTRLIITDNIQHTQVAYKIVLMSQCRVHQVGSYNEILDGGISIDNILTSGSYKNLDVSGMSDTSSPLIQDLAGTGLALNTGPQPVVGSRRESISGSAFDILHADFKTHDPGDPLLSMDSESSESGIHTSKAIYGTYFILGGGVCGSLIFLFISLLEQGAFMLCEWWLAYWTENYQNVTAENHVRNSVLGDVVDHVTYHIFIYIGIAVATVLLGLLQAMVFYSIARRAGRLLHDMALDSLLNAPLAFFDSTSRGGVLCHFLRDVGIVDSVPAVLLDSLQSFSVLGATMIVIGCANYWTCLALIPVVFLFLWARHRFHAATQDVERIELASKNAVCAHVVSSMEGIQSLRSLGVEQRFIHRFDVYQDRSTAACYLHVAANRWFAIRVDLLGMAVVLAVLVGATLVVDIQGNHISASLVGLSLYYAINLINVSQPTLRKSAAVHFKMASVSRLLQYYQLTPETPLLGEIDTPTIQGWPRYGIVTCEGVSVAQIGNEGSTKRKSLLKNMWCCIRAQEKMGIIFSTASEQRAFLSLLFRLTDFSGVLRIDGVDIIDVPKSKLRDKVALVSQNPTLFVGSVRENLDPESHFTDAQVWKVLEQVHMAGLIRSLNRKLATDLAIVVDYLTIGQRQLLRLASAILHQSKIIIYEEPTSSLDILCNSIIQEVLRTQFSTSTVVHIAHLPDTIIHTDRIMIISDGKIVEVDTPYYLLQNTSSKLSSLVAELGSAQTKHLQQAALEKHENRPYVAPPIDPDDFHHEFPPATGGDLKAPNNLNVLPTFHSSRLAGVLNQLPTNKFSTDRL